MKCPDCGGKAKSVAENKYHCPYCGNEFFARDPLLSQIPDLDRVVDRLTTPPFNSAPKKNEGVSVFEDNVSGVLEITWNPTPGILTSGSGLLINAAGYAITNAHVVARDDGTPTSSVNVKVAGETVKAHVIRLGDDKAGLGNGVDLALIKLDRVPIRAKVLSFADFADVRIGEQVFVIGNSLGDGTCITSGIVSDKERKINGHTVLMTDCAINGGNSGGPIFNSEGEVIGVICSSRIKADGSATEGMNYAIPVNIVEAFINGEYTAVKVKDIKDEIKFKSASSRRTVLPARSYNHDVFISFSFKDQAVADKVVDQLVNKYGIPTWICTKQIKAGENFRADIVDAIEVAKVVVFLQSTKSAVSKEVADEILYSFSIDKMVKPFKIEESTLRPELRMKFHSIHYIDATDHSRLDEKIYELARDICISIGKPFKAD